MSLEDPENLLAANHHRHSCALSAGNFLWTYKSARGSGAASGTRLEKMATASHDRLPLGIYGAPANEDDPKFTWRRSVLQEAENFGKTWQELNCDANNRNRWCWLSDSLCSYEGGLSNKEEEY